MYPATSWTLTKLVLLAGGTGDPAATAGQEPCVVSGGCTYADTRSTTMFLEPLLAAARATSPGRRRAWWLSGAGARARGRAR
eukprot:CAMPEP_0118941174 /NCGR_PEP_ID=MMETSP1169-20130426/33260_1 /TAXON_ID=36882 /ORGANISM="Pyramimonas obovata, Strain CCMP722" /LENGTH=81 /DNA_ID=CAMNT_0006885857 /DNA_START=70 /DNA_END=312 /DNA_ORIENTATION=+